MLGGLLLFLAPSCANLCQHRCDPVSCGETRADRTLADSLQGAWLMQDDANDAAADLPKDKVVKLFAGRRWSVSYVTGDTGVVKYHSGGEFSVKEAVITEKITFSNTNTEHLIGESNRFTASVQDGILSYNGKDRGCKEKWSRLEATPGQTGTKK